MTGVDDDGIRLVYHLATPDRIEDSDLHSVETTPLAAIAQLLNKLGSEGWELVAYDTTTNRGVFKRPKT
jgi:hypothetical protein